MEIKTIVNFSASEIETLKTAGAMIGNVNHALQNCDAEAINEEARELLSALKTVIEGVLNR